MKHSEKAKHVEEKTTGGVMLRVRFLQSKKVIFTSNLLC